MGIRNIISYKLGTPFAGKEILQWLHFHTSNQTSLSKEALRLNHHYGLTLNPNRTYVFYRGQERTSGPEVFLIKRF